MRKLHFHKFNNLSFSSFTSFSSWHFFSLLIISLLKKEWKEGDKDEDIENKRKRNEKVDCLVFQLSCLVHFPVLSSFGFLFYYLFSPFFLFVQKRSGTKVWKKRDERKGNKKPKPNRTSFSSFFSSAFTWLKCLFSCKPKLKTR